MQEAKGFPGLAQVHLGALRGPAHDAEPGVQVTATCLGHQNLRSRSSAVLCALCPAAGIPDGWMHGQGTICAGLRSFWRHVSDLERRETRRYLQMFYCLMMRPLIAKVSCFSARQPWCRESLRSADERMTSRTECGVRLQVSEQAHGGIDGDMGIAQVAAQKEQLDKHTSAAEQNGMVVTGPPKKPEE